MVIIFNVSPKTVDVADNKILYRTLCILNTLFLRYIENLSMILLHEM